MGAKAFFVGDQGMCKLLGTSTGRSSHAKVDFRSLVELQLPGVCFNVLGELSILSRGASFGRPMRGEFLSFAIASFHSSIGSPVVDTCTKAVKSYKKGLMRVGGRSVSYADQLCGRPDC
ncbi:hypothetical protein BHM03_00003857 [Ensete ventricosum]|nr:hypothetical protein BHM03_00003857 [Ensete ventricosum]